MTPTEPQAIRKRCEKATPGIKWLKEQCNRYANGQCHTITCLRRGGHLRGEPVDYNVATCEAHELIESLADLPALLDEVERLQKERDALQGIPSAMVSLLRMIRQRTVRADALAEALEGFLGDGQIEIEIKNARVALAAYRKETQ